MHIIGQTRSDEYAIAFPEKILRSAAEFCLTGIKQIGCQIAGPETNDKVNRLLNDSWKQFWIDPQVFHEWERKAVTAFKQTL